MSKWPTTSLKGHIVEVSIRKGETPAEVLSVTNTVGFVRSLDVFDKQVFSQDASNYKLVRFNDLAYNPSRINVGSVARCQFPEGGAVSPMYVVVRCNESLLPQFLLYFLKSSIGQQNIARRCVGAVRFMLRFGDLERIELPLPPLAEQERMVRIVDEVEELCRLRGKADERTSRIVSALLDDMFGDPATNPKDWRITPLKEVLHEFRYGTSNKSESNGFPTLRIPNVVRDQLDLTDVTNVPVGDDEFRRLQLRDGDLLFVRSNGSPELIGRSAVYDSADVKEFGLDPNRFIYASYLIRGRPKAELVDAVYLQTYLRTSHARAAVRSQARTSAGQYNINTTGLGAVPVPLPPLGLQHEFAASVGEVRELKAAQGASRQRLDDVFQSLLHRAFQGDL